LEREGEPKRLIVDTGSNASILQPGVSQSGISATSIKPHGVTGEALNIKGQQHVSFVLGGRKLDHTFLVCALPTEADGLLVTDFLDRTDAEINFEYGKLSLSGNYKAPLHVMACPDRAALCFQSTKWVVKPESRGQLNRTWTSSPWITLALPRPLSGVGHGS